MAEKGFEKGSVFVVKDMVPGRFIVKTSWFFKDKKYFAYASDSELDLVNARKVRDVARDAGDLNLDEETMEIVWGQKPRFTLRYPNDGNSNAIMAENELDLDIPGTYRNGAHGTVLLWNQIRKHDNFFDGCGGFGESLSLERGWGYAITLDDGRILAVEKIKPY